MACHLSKLSVCLKWLLMTKTRELHPQMTTARCSRWGAVILVLWAGQMRQLCRNPNVGDGLFLCFRSSLLKHENSRNKCRKNKKKQHLEVLLAQKNLNILNVLWFYAQKIMKKLQNSRILRSCLHERRGIILIL